VNDGIRIEEKKHPTFCQARTLIVGPGKSDILIIDDDLNVGEGFYRKGGSKAYITLVGRVVVDNDDLMAEFCGRIQCRSYGLPGQFKRIIAYNDGRAVHSQGVGSKRSRRWVWR